MPRPISSLSSSERSLKLKVLPAPIPIRASCSRISFSLGKAGANCSAKSRYSKKFVFTSSLSILGKSIAGGAGGAGCFRKADSGWHL